MTIKGAIVATIEAEPRRVVRGKTLLFKKLYFVSVITGEDFGFSPYFYGPYSDVVSDQVGALDTCSNHVNRVEAAYSQKSTVPRAKGSAARSETTLTGGLSHTCRCWPVPS